MTTDSKSVRPIRKVLIANRGEIACRVIRTLQALDIDIVAVFSEADADALHVRMADEALCIGPAPANESYLVIDKIIAAAKDSGADAIHPGYGFLSENAAFAKACGDNDIIFIGPPPSAIEAMGSKAAAKAIMETAGVPLVPGYHGDDQTDSRLQQEADKIGYPVLLKAAMGGGGKGMRLVEKASDFSNALQACRRESLAAFGDDRMLIEKYVMQPRHVEIQVFADQHGHCVYLFERDCSLQRRHQKVIEEAPAPGIGDTLRRSMGEAAVRAARSIGYQGAGTVEFLLDASGHFYFMEMNTRLQVEHPVTEMITGEDLVEWQLRVASGFRLPKTQQELSWQGHAFEVRIYAETPHNSFLPATGTVDYLVTPDTGDHVRIDTGIIENSDVTVFYDPMIAKLIVWDKDRSRALHRLDKALQNYLINGVQTNIEFLLAIIRHRDFQEQKLSTHFIEDHQAELITPPEKASEIHYIQAAIYRHLKIREQAGTTSPWSSLVGWQSVQPAGQTCLFDQDDELVAVNLQVTPHNGRQQFVATCGSTRYTVYAGLSGDRLRLSGDRTTVIAVHEKGNLLVLFEQGKRIEVHRHSVLAALSAAGHDGQLTAPMPGRIVEVLVAAGDTVEADAPLVIMEAMKMEHTIRAREQGTIKQVFFTSGSLVEEGAELIEFESQATEASNE
ncbi:MAG: acetyl/propionyl/methylcrotonyl-CoA carboxylase subunit alpha [Ketobacteraceae bacterium]|nr:acetyl/propionyl/methylcrotonyl-CoA carboxylase subunit alpha [Ketobacteraceae bacterium]